MVLSARNVLARLAGIGILVAGLAGWGGLAMASDGPFIIPAPSMEAIGEIGSSAKALFAGGCFWGVQGVFQHVEGVTSAVSGYSGGTADNARYELIGSGQTGHAEAVEVTYDPSKVSYGQLLHILFSVVHNPTQLNYQGPDHGPQYRSAIFPLNQEQAEMAEAYIKQLDATGIYDGPIVTRIEEFKGFYPAEDYHQDYLTLHPDSPYIVYNDLPKVENLKRVFAENYRDDPVLVSEAAQ